MYRKWYIYINQSWTVRSYMYKGNRNFTDIMSVFWGLCSKYKISDIEIFAFETRAAIMLNVKPLMIGRFDEVLGCLCPCLQARAKPPNRPENREVVPARNVPTPPRRPRFYAHISACIISSAVHVWSSFPALLHLNSHGILFQIIIYCINIELLWICLCIVPWKVFICHQL